MLHDMIPNHAILHNVILYPNMSYHGMLGCTMLYPLMLCYTTSCNVIQSCTMKNETHTHTNTHTHTSTLRTTCSGHVLAMYVFWTCFAGALHIWCIFVVHVFDIYMSGHGPVSVWTCKHLLHMFWTCLGISWGICCACCVHVLGMVFCMFRGYIWADSDMFLHHVLLWKFSSSTVHWASWAPFT